MGITNDYLTVEKQFVVLLSTLGRIIDLQKKKLRLYMKSLESKIKKIYIITNDY